MLPGPRRPLRTTSLSSTLTTPVSDMKATRPSLVSRKRAGLRPLRSSEAPSCLPSQKTSIVVQHRGDLWVVIILGLLLVRLGHERGECERRGFAATDRVLEHRVEVGRVRLVHRAERVTAATLNIEGALPVDVANERVDLAVVGEGAHGLGKRPLGHGVGREAAVVDGEVGREQLVGQRREIGLRDGGALDEVVGLGGAAEAVEREFELVAAELRVVNEGLPDGGQRSERHRTEDLLALRHVTPPNNLETLLGGLVLEDLLRLGSSGLILREEGHRHAHRFGRLASKRALLLKELPRHRCHHSRSVSGDAVPAASAAMLHASEGIECPLDDVVVVAPLRVRDEAHSTGVPLSNEGHWTRLWRAEGSHLALGE
eukprot:scaffold251553_cov31-Tisochrysis_lutea.AAC.1